ncbi:hypothetical protein F5X99DRAFT_425621, partial [Biscogniauxia marginata]
VATAIPNTLTTSQPLGGKAGTSFSVLPYITPLSRMASTIIDTEMDLEAAAAREESMLTTLKIWGSFLAVMCLGWVGLASFFIFHLCKPLKTPSTEDGIELRDLGPGRAESTLPAAELHQYIYALAIKSSHITMATDMDTLLALIIPFSALGIMFFIIYRAVSRALSDGLGGRRGIDRCRKERVRYARAAQRPEATVKALDG